MTYGELFMQIEYEMSCYNLDEANVEGQRQGFELYQQVLLPQLLLCLHGMLSINVLCASVYGTWVLACKCLHAKGGILLKVSRPKL